MNIHLPRMKIADDRYRWMALGATLIGGFMSILDTSIVNIALPKMMAVFSADTNDAQWILTAYMLTMGVLQPTTGYLCDTFGARRMYLMSLFVFTVGSALCGAAWSNESMILFRILQALGGGLIIPTTMSIVFHEFPPHERNTAMGIWGISATMAPAIGPTLSGYLVDFWDWRYIFTINIPIGIIGYFLAAAVLRDDKTTDNARFDLLGFVFCSVGLFCLLLALSKGVEEGWSSVYILSLLFVAVSSLIMFVLVEWSQDDPMLDLTLFKDWNFTISTLYTVMATTVLFGSIFLVPLFLENILNYTAMHVGLLLLPAAMLGGFMMPVAGKLADRFGAKPLVVFGALLSLGGTFPLIYMDVGTSPTYVMFVQIMRGLFLGFSFMTVTVLGMASVPVHKISRASALNNTIRQVSGSFGIAVLSTVMQNQQIFHLSHIAENFNSASIATIRMLQAGQTLFAGGAATPRPVAYNHELAIPYHKALAMLNGVGQQHSFIFAFDDAFWVLGLFGVAGLCIALLLKPVKSSGKPAAIID